MFSQNVSKLYAHTIREGDSGAVVKELQELLRKAGQELVADGEFGAITRAAVKRFQASVTPPIAVDGVVGVITARYLDRYENEPEPEKALPSALAIAPWLSRARAQTGTKEIPGAKSNPLILQWVAELGAKYPSLRPNIDWFTNDDIPWCGLGVANFVGLYDPGVMPPVAPLAAINWSTWGTKLDRPIQGAIGVKPRTGGNHVTLYESESKGKVYCRGANQNNRINLAEYSLRDFKHWRWPPGYPMIGKPITKKFSAAALVKES